MNETQFGDPRERLRTAARSFSPPARLEARIRSGIRESSRQTSWMRSLLPLAAALLVSLGGVIAYQLGHLRLTTKSQESYIATISSRVAGVMRVGLGDHVHCAVFRKFPKNPPTLEKMAQDLGPDQLPRLCRIERVARRHRDLRRPVLPQPGAPDRRHH